MNQKNGIPTCSAMADSETLDQRRCQSGETLFHSNVLSRASWTLHAGCQRARLFLQGSLGGTLILKENLTASLPQSDPYSGSQKH
jgi:hypothetical protein